MLGDWSPRRTAPDLAARYRAEGLWTDDTVGSLLHDRLTAAAGLELRIWSAARPWRGRLGDVHHRARRLAGALRGRGIGPGDVVAFQLPNWVEAAVTFYGVALSGATLVPVVHFYGPKELGWILRQSGARALVTAARFGHLDYLAGLEELRPSLPDLELVAVVGGDAPAGAVAFDSLLADDAAGDAVEGPVAIDPDAAALVAYTSGTTADPKGVVHTHRSLVAEVRQLSAIQPDHGRPALVGAPVGHAIGMLAGLLLPVHRGEAIHLTDVWDPGAVLAAMVEADLTSGSGATFFLTSLLDHPSFGEEHLARMRFVGLGGSSVPAAVGDRAASLGIAIARSFGSTEHPSTTGALHAVDPEEKRRYTDGRPLPGVELRLEDDGEILSRGPDLFAGYTDADLTAQAFRDDGWYATGDVGVLDEDGYLTITDRKKDVIIRGGENISAVEVEELLARLPGVAEVAVVAAPDERLGEHAAAFVRAAPGADPPTLDDVRAHLAASGLARPKWPEELHPVDDLPRTPSGKVKKFVLRDRLRSAAP